MQARSRNKHYLCGPMNRPALAAVAEELRGLGKKVFSPGEMLEVPGWEWEDYMRCRIAELAECQVLVVMAGHEDSRAAKLEMEVARELGLRRVHTADCKNLKEVR